MIARDAQGAELVPPLGRKGGGTYGALLDQDNFIGKAYNLKYVPVGLAVDETGRLVRPVGSVNIQDAEFLADLKGVGAVKGSGVARSAELAYAQTTLGHRRARGL